MLYNEGKYGWEYYIKSYITSYSVFSYYLNHTFVLGKVFNSPLRKDNTPSFCIFKGDGELLYKDFATGESGDCIKFVQKKLNTSRRGAIINILINLFKHDLKDSYEEVVPEYHRERKEPSVGLKTTDFTPSDISFWNSYYISTNTLEFYNVLSVSHAWINDNLVWFRNDKEPIYAYVIDNKIKIYRPFSKRGKWGGNTTMFNVFGFKQLPSKGDTLIITKGGKDVMVLYELGYNAIAPNSETAILPESVINNLKERYKNIYVLMDNDEAGKKAGSTYNKLFNLKDIYLSSKEKDISDYIKEYGVQQTKQMFTSLLKL